ncbi:hypothetical protein KUTeg_004063, partial [Tegillarca granosa]
EAKKGVIFDAVHPHKDALIKNKHQNEKLYQEDTEVVGFHDDTFYLDDEERLEKDDKEFSNGLQNIEKNASKKLPQALIIGVKKSGTKALLEFLRIHPDIRAPGAEVHFFDKFYSKGFKWYRRQMPSTLDGQITIEKTQSYFTTKDVPKRVRTMSKDVKLLVVVRDPVTRAISDYTQSSIKHKDLGRFEDLVFVDNTTGLVDTSWTPIKTGVYAKHLERWINYFPIENIHFVSGEELIRDPATELEMVQKFLGLKVVITNKHFYFNVSRGFPCLKKQEKHGRPHCLGVSKSRDYPFIKDKVIKRLRNFYKPFNRRFYQMTGRDFNWI